MNKNLTRNELADKITAHPTISSNPLYAEIIRGMYQGKPLLGPNGLLTDMVKELTQLALQGEMDAHLQDNGLEEGGNRKNGLSSKSAYSCELDQRFLFT